MTMNSRPLRWRPARAAAKSLWLVVSMLLVPAGLVSAAVADGSLDDYRCGPLAPPGQYGPYDYRTATKEQKYLVEAAHFNSNTELLIRGTSTERPGPDINYTLRVFPNHPRALKSAMDLGMREKTSIPFGMRYTTECWFNRALRFAPDDPQVRMVYGIYLMRTGAKKAAVEQFELASKMGLSGGNFHYNLGLAYFQAQEYEKARLQAYKAKELGYELPGLQNLLTKAGQWREQEPGKGAPKEPDASAPKAPDSATPETTAPKN